MSPNETNILDQKLTGITWKVIATVAGGVFSLAVVGFKMYFGIIGAIMENKKHYEMIEKDISSIQETTKRHEEQILYLIRKEKDNE